MGGKTRLRGELKGGKPEQTLGRNEHLPRGHHTEGAAGPVTQLCDPKRTTRRRAASRPHHPGQG